MRFRTVSAFMLLGTLSTSLVFGLDSKSSQKDSSRRVRQFMIEEMPAPILTPPRVPHFNFMPANTLRLSAESGGSLKALSFASVPRVSRYSAEPLPSLPPSAPAEKAIQRTVSTQEGIRPTPIIFSPRRFPQRADRVSENVSVLQKEALKNLPAGDPAEALVYVPSVNVPPRTKFGHFTPISIQGSESRHVLVMVDGIPFNTQASGQADILPALSLTPVERIEIVQGAASSAWGTGLGGAVNLITKEPASSARPTGKVRTAFSGFAGQAESFETGGTAGPVGYYLSGDYRSAGGARTTVGTVSREDTLQKKSFGKLVYHWAETTQLSASLGYSGAQANEGIYPADGTLNEMPYAARYGQVRFEADPTPSQHVEAAVKFNRQNIQTNNFDGSTGDLYSSTKILDHYYGAELKHLSKFRQDDTLALGLDVSTTTLKTNLMANARDVLVQAPYGSYHFVQGPVEVAAGARYDVNQLYGAQFNPNLGAVYRTEGTRQTVFRVNASRAFSAPPLLWRYFEDVVPGLTVNNPDLRPERAWVYETGAEMVMTKTWQIGGRWYRSDITDGITTVMTEDGFFMKQNFDKFRSVGFEANTTVHLHPRWTVSLASTFNDVTDRSTGQTVQNRGVSRPGFRVQVAYEAWGGIQCQLLARYDRWDASSALEPNDRKFILDGRLSKTITKVKGLDFTAFLNASNLTNSKYWMAKDLPLPERYFEGGASVEF